MYNRAIWGPIRRASGELDQVWASPTNVEGSSEVLGQFRTTSDETGQFWSDADQARSGVGQHRPTPRQSCLNDVSDHDFHRSKCVRLRRGPADFLVCDTFESATSQGATRMFPGFLAILHPPPLDNLGCLQPSPPPISGQQCLRLADTVRNLRLVQLTQHFRGVWQGRRQSPLT